MDGLIFYTYKLQVVPLKYFFFNHDFFPMVNVTAYAAQPVSVDQIVHVLVISTVAFIFLVTFFGLGGAR